MIAIAALFFVATTAGFQGDNLSPSGPICFSLGEPKEKLPIDDVVRLKKVWNSKDFQTFPSGNYGLYRNGTYFVISKSTPILKELEDRFNLAIKVIKVGAGQPHIQSMFALNGTDFSSQELGTLSRLIERWGGSVIPVASLSTSKPLLFDSGTSLTFSDRGQRIAVFPTIHFDSFEAEREYRKSIMSQRPGILEETDFETSNKHRYSETGLITGTEATEGAIYTKVQNALGTNEDFVGINSALLEFLSKVCQTKLSQYRLAILEAVKPYQQALPNIFGGIGNPGLSDSERQQYQKSVTAELQRQGYSPQEAENRAPALTFSGRNVEINFVTSIRLYNGPVNGPMYVHIWP